MHSYIYTGSCMHTFAKTILFRFSDLQCVSFVTQLRSIASSLNKGLLEKRTGREECRLSAARLLSSNDLKMLLKVLRGWRLPLVSDHNFHAALILLGHVTLHVKVH